MEFATVNVSRTAKIKEAYLGRDSAMWSMRSRRMGIGPREHIVDGAGKQRGAASFESLFPIFLMGSQEAREMVC